MSCNKLTLAAFMVTSALGLTGCDSGSSTPPDDFRNPCLDCNPDKPKPLQSIDRVGAQAWMRDSSGNIVSRDVGSPILVGHGGAPGVGFLVQPVQLQLQDGTWVEATRSLGQSTTDGRTFVPDHRLDADCHGVTFTNGQYWINDDQVDTMLRGGGFRQTTTPKVGDVAVYRDSAGNVVHSVTVTKVDPTTGQVLEVSGLGGIQMHEHINTPRDGWSDPTATITYYTR